MRTGFYCDHHITSGNIIMIIIMFVFVLVVSSFLLLMPIVESANCNAACSPHITLPCTFPSLETCLMSTCQRICSDIGMVVNACYCRGSIERTSFRACFCQPNVQKVRMQISAIGSKPSKMIRFWSEYVILSQICKCEKNVDKYVCVWGVEMVKCKYDIREKVDWYDDLIV